jgi:hypothetical protein
MYACMHENISYHIGKEIVVSKMHLYKNIYLST